jgi:hypothetical protein
MVGDHRKHKEKFENFIFIPKSYFFSGNFWSLSAPKHVYPEQTSTPNGVYPEQT